MKDPIDSSSIQRGEIDGLRAVAVLSVVLFHAGLGFRGGFMGVDVFFVISGFLIGGIILRELDAGAFSFCAFWERRVRRIIPAVLFLLAVLLAVGWLVLPAPDLASLGAQTVASLAGLANFKMLALRGGYWATAAHSILLLHIWSLAVEEQFYLLLPVLLAPAHRWFARRMPHILLALFFVSFAACVYLGQEGDPAHFYLLPCRAWELLFGCLGAWAMHHGLALPRSLKPAAAAFGVLMILASAFLLRGDANWPDARALLPTLGTFLVLIAPASEGQRSWALGLLRLSPARFIGRISYSLYLWHWPAIVFLVNYGPDEITLGQRLAVVAVSVALGGLSWRFIEQPFRNKAPSLRVPIKPLLIGAGAAWLCLMAASVKTAQATPRDFDRPGDLPAPFQGRGFETIAKYDSAPRLAEGGIQFNAGNHAARCVLLGSSHAMALGPVVESLCNAYHIPSAFFSQSGMSALFVGAPSAPRESRKIRRRRTSDRLVKQYISRWKPDLVIVGARWSQEMVDIANGSKPAGARFQESFCGTIDWLCRNAGQVVVLDQVPQLPQPAEEDLFRFIWKRYRANGNQFPRLFEPTKAAALRHESSVALRACPAANLTILNPDPVFLNSDRSIRYFDEGGMLYGDCHHLNSFGSEKLRPLLEPIFRKLSEGSGP